MAAAVVLLAGTFGCSPSGADTTSGNDTPSSESTTTASRDTSAPSTEPEAFPGETAAPATDEVAAIGTYGVGSNDFEVVDASRSTDAWGGQPELPERTLPTLVLYPAADGPNDGADADAIKVVPDARPRTGPWPMVVFSHGRGGTGPAYVNTLKLWASAGYVVVVPTYPLTSALTPGQPKTEDLANQPADVSFLIDWALGLADDHPLAGMIDPDQIGLAGHSLGGFTSLAAAYNPKLRDERIDAVGEWAGSYLDVLADGGPPIDDGPPLLIVHGDADGTVGYSAALATAAAVGPPWGLVTLVGGEHIPPYIQGLADPYSAVVTQSTLDFFDATLKDDPEGEQRLKDVIDKAGPQVATFVEAKD